MEELSEEEKKAFFINISQSERLLLSEAAKFLTGKGIQEADILISALIEEKFLNFEGFIHYNGSSKKYYGIPDYATSAKCSVVMNDILITEKRPLQLPTGGYISSYFGDPEHNFLLERVTVRKDKLCSLLGIDVSLQPANADSPREQPPEVSEPKPSGIQTNRAANAVEECKKFIASLPPGPRRKKDDVRATAKEQEPWGKNLSDRGFGQAWADAAPDEWKKGGAPKKA